MKRTKITAWCVALALSLSATAPAPAQTSCTQVGPDIIVGDITTPANYTAQGELEALSLGTTSCNIGDAPANWVSSTNQHPVIGGALFRLRTVDGATRFEQVGMSWLKHGFVALSGSLCCPCLGGGGSQLGVHCSDPYGGSLNGSQGGLGPRWQVNARTGVFTYPPANPTWTGSTARRLEVAIADLAATDRYFGECIYVTQDDATAGTQNNNASYREVAATGSGSAWNFALVGATIRGRSAVEAWPLVDPGVQQTVFAVPGEGGKAILSWKVTALGGGQHRYEYSLYNMNSDVGFHSFGVPVAGGPAISNAGFHDVVYRNGDGPGNTDFDGTDWATGQAAGHLSWSTQTFAQNPTANAIRWSTAYNFRFDSAAAPTTGAVRIGLYKTGQEMTLAGVQVPDGGPATGTAFCAADGLDPLVTTGCPCDNAGTSGRGCENSAGTGGALLSASGTTAPDAVVLTSSGELANAPSVFLQGDASVAGGAPFGDGVRCVGGTLLRLYVRAAVGGVVSAPQALDASITARSAALGDPIAPGSTRYYQVYYRDPDPAFCFAPIGSTWNVSSGQQIVW